MKRKAVLYGIVAAIVLLGCEQEVKVPQQQIVLELTGRNEIITLENGQVLMAGLLEIYQQPDGAYAGDMVGVGEIVDTDEAIPGSGKVKFWVPAPGSYLPTLEPFIADGEYVVALAAVAIEEMEIKDAWADSEVEPIADPERFVLRPRPELFLGSRLNEVTLDHFNKWGDWEKYTPKTVGVE